MDGADTDDEEPSSSARRHSGYKLEWLQSISLEGLQCLAKIHDLDPSADVPELIEGLRRDDDDEESDAEEDEGAADIFEVATDVTDATPALEDMTNNTTASEDVLNDAPVVEADAPVVSAEDSISVPLEEAAAAAADIMPTKGSAKRKPWMKVPFLPQKSTKVLTVAEPFAIASEPASARKVGSLKSLEAAARKKEADNRKLEEASARRATTASRRERILSTFKQAQANARA